MLRPKVPIILMFAELTACSQSGTQEACRSLGFCDEKLPPPVILDVLCDPSQDAPCNHDTLSKTLEASLRFAVLRPGSRVRLFMLGKDIASTSMIGEQITPKPAKGSERAKKTASERFIGSAKDFFAAAATPALDAPAARRSPLAEALTKVGLADDGGLPRHVIVISDAREVGITDMECVPNLIKDDAFVSTLKKQQLLGSGLFAGVDIDFVFEEFRPNPNRGCTVAIDREMKVRGLWNAALHAAGAAQVRFSSGPVVFTSDDGLADDTKGGTK